MMKSTDGQTPVVTARTRDIGFAAARAFKDRGVHVARWDMDPFNASTAESLGDGTVSISCEITGAASVEAAYPATREALGQPSILVNRIGIARPNATVADYDVGDWKHIIDTNLIGTFLVDRVVVSSVIEQNNGRALNVASVAGKEGNPKAAKKTAWTVSSENSFTAAATFDLSGGRATY